jgi:hypothetical protein
MINCKVFSLTAEFLAAKDRTPFDISFRFAQFQSEGDMFTSVTNALPEGATIRVTVGLEG